MPERLQGRSPPRHGNFTVGPPFCVGKDRLRPPSQNQEPGLVLEVCLPFLDIHLAEWRPRTSRLLTKFSSSFLSLASSASTPDSTSDFFCPCMVMPLTREIVKIARQKVTMVFIISCRSESSKLKLGRFHVRFLLPLHGHA